jgi:hypothetical protein
MKPKLLLALKVLKRFLLVVEPKDVVKIKENHQIKRGKQEKLKEEDNKLFYFIISLKK